MKRHCWPVFLIFLSVLLAAQSQTAANRRQITANRVLTAKLLLKAVYPELAERHLRTVVMDDGSFEWHDSLNSFTMLLCEYTPPKNVGLLPPPPNRSAKPNPIDICSEEVFHASFVFPGSNILPWEFGYHDFELQKRLRVLENMFDDHQSWSYEQRIAAMKNGGMMFGPDDKEAFLRRFPAKALEAIFGPIHIVKAEFSPRPEVVDGSAVLNWAIDFETRKPNGKKMIYTAWANPIDGKVDRIAAHGAEPPVWPRAGRAGGADKRDR